MLFGVKPHTAPVIQRLEQSSFVILTFKYVGSVLLMVDMEEADTDLLGTGFILLDVIYIIHSLTCLVAVAHAVWNAANNKEVDEENAATRGVSVHPVSRDRDLEKVEEIEQNHQAYRNMAVHNIIQRISKRRTSLGLRVEARKKVKQFNALLKSDCFSNLDPASISKIIDEMEFIVIKENNYDMCRQGDNATIFYIIVSGACQVILDGKPVAMLGEMDIFGESALFTDGNGQSIRGATVTTVIDGLDNNVQVLALPRAKFNTLLASGVLNEHCVNKLKAVAEQRRQENATTVVNEQPTTPLKMPRAIPLEEQRATSLDVKPMKALPPMMQPTKALISEPPSKQPDKALKETPPLKQPAKPLNVKPMKAARPLKQLAKPLTAKPLEETPPLKQPAKPLKTKPLKAKPLETKPLKTKPLKAKPLKAKPLKAKPLKAKPLKTKPLKTKPLETKPLKAKPLKAKPLKAKPLKTKPPKAKPLTAKSLKAKSSKAKPLIGGETKT